MAAYIPYPNIYLSYMAEAMASDLGQHPHEVWLFEPLEHWCRLDKVKTKLSVFLGTMNLCFQVNIKIKYFYVCDTSFPEADLPGLIQFLCNDSYKVSPQYAHL